jgi:hypothetical protein
MEEGAYSTIYSFPGCCSPGEGRAIAQAISRWASHHGDPGSNPVLVMWDLWWTKWRWGGFSPSISVAPANLYSTNCCTITIICHLGLVQ